MSDLRTTFAAVTDAGRRRSANEDAYLAMPPVFVVADGMGGHDAGDLASAAVVEAFRPLGGRPSVSVDHVARAVETAHATVAALAATTARGAGSTLTAIVAVDHDGQPSWLVVNVGDSRVYRLVADRLEQITVDHSVAQEMVDAGRLDRADMARFPGRNVITRAVGGERNTPDYWLLPIVTGERFLLCSDGLTSELSDEAIRAGLTLGGAPDQTAEALVAGALALGGRDNVTVIVLDVVAGGAAPRSADHTSGRSLTSDSTTAEAITLQTRRTRRRHP